MPSMLSENAFFAGAGCRFQASKLAYAAAARAAGPE